MIYSKKKGSLLNYIQMPLNVITPDGTYLGLNYTDDKPNYILSHVKVKTYDVGELTFSIDSKKYIINNESPVLEMKDDVIGYKYSVSDTEKKYGYITAASLRVDITENVISESAAEFILEKQLRNIGRVLERFVNVKLGQPQYDALLVYFYYNGVAMIEDSELINQINEGKWYDITDTFQSDIKKADGQFDEEKATRSINIAKMWSYVPGF